MAITNFDPLVMSNIELNAPDGRVYHGWYSDIRIDRKSLPEGYHAYDIRSDDLGLGVFCSLEHNYVVVNNEGSIVLDQEIPELKDPGSVVYFHIDPDEWISAQEDEDKEPAPENDPDDWEYSFE